MENRFEIVKLDFKESVEKFNLHFLPNYCHQIYKGEWLIFKEDAHFEILDLDKLAKNSNAILFEKDLYVQGIIVQEKTDYGPLVVIKGQTQTKNIYTGGSDIFFRGDVIVEQTIIGVYNHGTVHFNKDIKAELIVKDNHSFNLTTNQIKKGITYGFSEEEEFAAIDLFKPNFYDRYNECLNTSAILKAMQKGNSVKKDGSILKPLEKAISKFVSSKQNIKSKLLNLSSLNLKEIPKKVFDLDDVYELDLSANYINTLPTELLKLKQLKKINLNNCEFTEFPILLLSMPSLEIIDLNENEISYLPSGLSTLTNLKKLYLSHCYFDIFPQTAYSIPNLETLDISYQQNQAEFVIDKTFTNLKTLNISANFGSTITAIQPKLENLIMRNCALKEIPTVIFSSPQLKSLDITLNQINSLSKEITHLTRIMHLLLSISYLDKESITLLHHLPKLSKLTLAFSDEAASTKINYFLELEQWTELYCEGCLEDQFLIKAILQRPNLKKLISVINQQERPINIKKERALFGIII